MKKLLVVVALLAIGAGTQAALVAEWTFEQNLMDNVDMATLVGMKTYPGNGVYDLPASVQQDPTYEAGFSGYAVRIGAIGTYSYEGSNVYPWASGYTPPAVGASYLSTTGDSIDIGNIFTMEGYFKADSVDYAYVRLLTKWVSSFTQSYHFTIHNGALEIIHKNGSGGNVTLTDNETLAALGVEMNQWFHTAVTGDGSNLTLWLNGVAVASAAYNGTTTNSTSPFWIGGRQDIINPATNNNAFVGLVDNVRIWDEAKDAAYMLDRFNAIPEPTTITMLILGALSLVRRKK